MAQLNGSPVPAEQEELTFEAAMDQLERIIAGMESGKLPLEESIASFEKGVSLVRYCRAKLDAYTEKINKLAEPVEGVSENG